MGCNSSKRDDTTACHATTNALVTEEAMTNTQPESQEQAESTVTSYQLQNDKTSSQTTPLPDSETTNVKKVVAEKSEQTNDSIHHPAQGELEVLDVHASNTHHENLSLHQENLQAFMGVKILLSTNERSSMYYGETRSKNEEDVKRLVSLHTVMGLGIHSKFIVIYIYIYIYI